MQQQLRRVQRDLMLPRYLYATAGVSTLVFRWLSEAEDEMSAAIQSKCRHRWAVCDCRVAMNCKYEVCSLCYLWTERRGPGPFAEHY